MMVLQLFNREKRAYESFKKINRQHFNRKHKYFNTRNKNRRTFFIEKFFKILFHSR